MCIKASKYLQLIAKIEIVLKNLQFNIDLSVVDIFQSSCSSKPFF